MARLSVLGIGSRSYFLAALDRNGKYQPKGAAALIALLKGTGSALRVFLYEHRFTKFPPLHKAEVHFRKLGTINPDHWVEVDLLQMTLHGRVVSLADGRVIREGGDNGEDTSFDETGTGPAKKTETFTESKHGYAL